MHRVLIAALMAAGVAAIRHHDPIEGPHPELTWPRPEAARPEAPVALTARASHPYLLAGETQDVYLYLSLVAAELPEAPRPSMNLALVIDRSGSMASERKLSFAKSAAEQFVGRLRPDDRLALVAYDDDITTLVPSAPASHQDVFLDAIEAIRSGGSTDLHGGLTAGYEEVLRHYDDTRLNRVLLLSDGLANVGVTDGPTIQARAARCRDQGVRISTMGMGLSYDDVLLSGIARDAGGNYYYVDAAEAVGACLDEELDRMARTVARRLELRIALGPEVESWEIFGTPTTCRGRTVTVPVNDMCSGERRKVVVRLRVRGSAADAGRSAALATAAVRYVDAATQAVRKEQAPTLRYAWTEDAALVERSRDLDVLVKAEVVHNAEAMLASMKLQRQGDLAGARELLEARYRTCRLLNDTEYRSAELTRMLKRMRQTLMDLERTANDAAAQRDLQLTTDLRGLGYVGDD